MDLAFLHPLYEHSGASASVYVDTSRHTGSTPDERHLTASALVRRLAEQGTDEATCSAVRTAVEPAVRRTELRSPGERNSWAARADDALSRSAVAAGAPVLLVTGAGEETPAGGLGALLRRT
ncbi:hypothetical protein ACF05L_29540 [Streptomyces bobili]|uniref:hypothetical protein n=1 Tax=Streptomyces bobili TaxID=67280 RepID=UPI0036F5884F